MNQNFQSIFQIVCGLVVLVMCYYIYMVITTYLVLDKLKPSHVNDLPEFSKIWWVPFAWAVALYFFKQ